MRLVVLALAVAAAAAGWRAAPDGDARSFNDRLDRECSLARAHAGSQALFERGPYRAPAEPAICQRPAEREHWDAQWLTIAAALLVGSGVIAAVARR